MSTGARPCPMCGAGIEQSARSCKHCGEGLDPLEGGPVDALPADEPALWTNGTNGLRYIAAMIDNAFAAIVAIMAAMAIEGDAPNLKTPLLFGSFFTYFMLFEGWLSRTPGKLLTGLVIVQLDGTRCTWRHALIRTGFRMLEVNPFLVGALPAAITILCTKYHQRFGDRFAGTVVVSKKWQRNSGD